MISVSEIRAISEQNNNAMIDSKVTLFLKNVVEKQVVLTANRGLFNCYVDVDALSKPEVDELCRRMEGYQVQYIEGSSGGVYEPLDYGTPSRILISW